MEQFIYLIKYLISFELKCTLIAICNSEACIISKEDWAGFVRYTFGKIISIQGVTGGKDQTSGGCSLC